MVAFNIGGLSDIVKHRRSGYLAQSFDVEDLAKGVRWVLENRSIRQEARELAVTRFSNNKVAAQYCKVYESVLTA